jgi:hypothetical protein
MLRTGVAVEKLGSYEKRRKLGDRKCPGDSEKSFVELPDAIQFLQIPSERVFQQPPDFSTVIASAGHFANQTSFPGISHVLFWQPQGVNFVHFDNFSDGTTLMRKSDRTVSICLS